MGVLHTMCRPLDGASGSVEPSFGFFSKLQSEPATSRQRFGDALWMIYKGVLYRIPLYWRSSSDPATALKAGNKAGNVAVLPAHLPA